MGYLYQANASLKRLLRGHPNIVNFIDASWHALPNGAYEVFIMMELCAGMSRLCQLKTMSDLVRRWRHYRHDESTTSGATY